MLRPLAVLAAAAAFAVPVSADAVYECESIWATGHEHVITVCVLADYGLDHTTVNPTVGVDCTVRNGREPLCAMLGTDELTVGRTGIEQGSGDLWVAGAPVIIQ